jgi:hypothetical protein
MGHRVDSETRVPSPGPDGSRRFDLDQVQVAHPCTADWHRMVGDDRVRFCGECQKNVYHLSAMTRAEAEELLARHDGQLCKRFYRRADGTVLTADGLVGLRVPRGRTAGAMGGGLLAAAAAISGCQNAPIPTADPAPASSAELMISDEPPATPLPSAIETPTLATPAGGAEHEPRMNRHGVVLPSSAATLTVSGRDGGAACAPSAHASHPPPAKKAIDLGEMTMGAF